MHEWADADLKGQILETATRMRAPDCLDCMNTLKYRLRVLHTRQDIRYVSDTLELENLMMNM